MSNVPASVQRKVNERFAALQGRTPPGVSEAEVRADLLDTEMARYEAVQQAKRDRELEDIAIRELFGVFLEFDSEPRVLCGARRVG